MRTSRRVRALESRHQFRERSRMRLSRSTNGSARWRGEPPYPTFRKSAMYKRPDAPHRAPRSGF